MHILDMNEKNNIKKDADQIRQILEELSNSYKLFLDSMESITDTPPKESPKRKRRSRCFQKD